MPSEEKKNLESILKPCLKRNGFKKSGSTWWRHPDDFIQVVNIQGSQFSKKYYINLGVYLKELGDKEKPAEYDCHVRVRLNSLVSNNVIHNLLNYEDYGINEINRNKLVALLENEGLPWLNHCSSYEGAKKEYVLPNRVMTKFQREMLDEYFA